MTRLNVIQVDLKEEENIIDYRDELETSLYAFVLKEHLLTGDLKSSLIDPITYT